MDSEDDCAVVGLGKCYETFNDVESVEGIKTACRFVQKENARACDQFTCDANSPFLATRNAATASFLGSNELVLDVVDPELSHDLLYPLLFHRDTHISRQAQQGTCQDRFFNSQCR